MDRKEIGTHDRKSIYVRDSAIHNYHYGKKQIGEITK